MPERDDFLVAVKGVLANRVNGHCSNPACKAATRGPHSEISRFINVGVAAHITAAAPGGPRYDASLLPEQRKSIDNAIWLCDTCSVLIDRDEAAFPVPLLRQWKTDAEARARTELGRTQVQQPQSNQSEDRAHQETITRLVETNAILVEEITRLRIEVPVAQLPASASDDKWKLQIDLALSLCEAEGNDGIYAARAIIRKVREASEYNELSVSLRTRVATIAAKCAEKFGQQEAAIEELELALKLSPDEPRSVSNGAGAALQQGDWERALILAKRALAFDKTDENASLVLVQVWIQQEKFDAIEEFLLQAPHFLDSANGLAILASARRAQGRVEEAIELAQKAVVHDGKNIVALEELYDSCFRPIRVRMLQEGWLQRSHTTRRRMQLAQAAIGRAARLVETSLNRVLWQRLVINHAAVASARGRFAEALSLSERILNDHPAPNEREFALCTQGFSLLRLGRYRDAIAPLQAVNASGHHPEAAFGLAYCLNLSGETEEAATLYRSIWKPEERAGAGEVNDFLIAEELIGIYLSQNKSNESHEVLARLENSYGQHPEVRAIAADLMRAEGHSDQAFTLLAQAIEQSSEYSEDVMWNLWIRLADWHYKESHFQEAANAWGQVPLECLAPHYAKMLLHALYASEQYKRALEVARFIHANLGFQLRAAEIEAAILSYQGERREAKALYHELARREPERRHHVVNEAHVAVQNGEEEEARQLLQAVTVHDFATDAHELRRIANLKSYLKLDDALDFAFRARQIDYGNPESHRLYVAIFYHLTRFHSINENGDEDNGRAANVLGLNGPRWGRVPCTIRMAPFEDGNESPSQLAIMLGEEMEPDQSRWRAFTILEQGPFDRAHGFYSPQDELAQRLLAMTADDTIRLYCSHSRSERLFRVGAVLHPYIHAFQESNTEAQRLFPDGSSSLRTIDVSNGLDEFWALLEKQREGDEYIFQGYIDWRAPLSCVAHWRGRSYADTWEGVSAVSKLGLHAQRGTFEDWELSVEAVRRSLENDTPTLVLDWGGAMALVRWNLHDVIGPHFRYVAAESLHRAIKTRVQEAREDKASYLVPTTTGWRVSEPTLEERQIRISEVEELLRFFDQHVRVVPPREVISFRNAQLDEWSNALGECTVDSMLVALEYQAPLFADDAVLRRLMPFCKGLETVCCTSSQAILRALHIGELLSQDAYFESIQRLLSNNYKFLFADSLFCIWLLEREEYRLTTEVRRMLSSLEYPGCGENMAILRAADIIVTLIHTGVMAKRTKRFWNIFHWVLLALSTGRLARPALTEFCQQLADPSFKLSPQLSIFLTLKVVRWLEDVGLGQ